MIASGRRTALALALLTGCAPARPGPRGPAVPGGGAIAALERGALAGAPSALLAVEMATGDTLVARHADLRLVPGSTLKLATAVAALDLLGPEFRWRTELWSPGALDAATGTLEGALILSATGDPTFSSTWFPEGPLARVVEAVSASGVRRIRGPLVVDASAWDSTTVHPTWMAGDLPFAFSATGGAFALFEGETHVEVRGGTAPGDPVAVDWWPRAERPGEEGFVISRIRTAADSALEVVAHFLPEARRLELTGAVPPASVDTLAFATRDPVRQAAAALHRALLEAGIEVEGGWRIVWTPGETLDAACVAGATSCPGRLSLGTVESPPLLDVVEAMLEPSQNWIAEQLVRTLGTLDGGRGSWASGTDVVARHLRETVGVRPRDARVVDGSGLSVQNLLTPRALVRLLRHARARPWGGAFRAALPEPGEPESTLQDRLPDLQGRLWAKTGSMTHVGSLAGYLVTRDGREVVFAVLVNGANVPGAMLRDAIDEAVRTLAADR